MVHELRAWRTLHGFLPTSAADAEPREMNIPEFLLEMSIVIIAVVSVLTNLSVLLCFTQSADLRSHVPGIFVLNLSFSNILLTVINMPATFLGVAQRAKPFGDLFCHAVSFTETFITSNAMLSMAALSMDRWIAVVFPLSYSSKMRYRDAFLIVAYSWLHALTFSLTQLMMEWGGYSHTYASCTVHMDAEDGTQLAAYATFTALFHCSSFALCLFVMCFAYLKVLRVARSHCKRIDVITVQTLLLLVDIHPSVKERCLAQQKKRRQRASKKICIFIGSFILCFSPYVTTRLVELFPSVHIPRYWGIATKCLFYAKASSDPFVYCLLRQQYRKVLVSVISRVLRKDQYFLSVHSMSSTLDTADDSCVARVT
ncbi:G-protein coupled receptor 26 [Embiotoca jacksoni]|uniref:G-protein coupled receptor 26 n=1 Tax=Embiotoca jacksoni TaxID=100190 RepID=UPI00370456D1